MRTRGNPDWFGGNQYAVEIFDIFVELLHIWDDLVDKDKPVEEAAINRAFLHCLVHLPANPVYRAVQDQILPMWVVVVSSYEAANKFERDKDPHGLEISHGLRYAAGQILAYVVHVCVGADRAREVLPEVWKAIYYERFDEYRKEHLNDSAQQI